MDKIKRIDNVSALLGLFILVLIVMVYYLYKIEKYVDNYSENHIALTELKLRNKGFDDFSHSLNELSNYNILNQEIEEFKRHLETLKQEITLNYPNDTLLLEKIQNVTSSFKQKESDLEYFKSLNSSLIAGSHFLFDLQRTISDENKISLDIKSLVNEALFYLFQFTKSSYIDKSYVLQKFSLIQKKNKKDKNSLITNFDNQSTVLLETLSNLKEVSKNIRDNSLEFSLNELEQELDLKYRHYLFEQQVIASFFFVSSLIILVVFILMYRRSLKNQKELLAFNYAVQHSDNSIVMTDPEKNIVFVNEVFEKTTGYSAQEVLGKNPRILKSNLQDRHIFIEMYNKLSRGKSWKGELINQKKDGTVFYERASIIPIYLHNKLINYLAIKLDITEYIEQNKVLKQAASVFENTEEVIIIADANAKVVSVNKAFTDIYGYTLEDIKGRNVALLHSGAQNQEFYKHMWEKIQRDDLFKGKIINKTKNDEDIPVWITIKAVRNGAGEIVNYTSVQTDLRMIESSEAKADYLAYHDPLTGLYNRVSFEEYLNDLIQRSKKTDQKFALLLIDLDRFKIINDTLGHDTGDKVLMKVTQRLKKILKQDEYIARWGGDEFTVVLQNTSSQTYIATVARKIIEGLKKSMYIDHYNFTITASLGIVLYPQHAQDTNTLVKYADSAMYLAKENGKNNFSFYTEQLSSASQEKLNIDIALHDALKNDEVFMVYQPQYLLKNRQIVSVEALVRWKNKNMGPVSPEKFIPIAEDNGFVRDLGYFIFEESCKGFKKIKDAGVKLERIAINVSSVQFREVDLPEIFFSIAQRYGLSPDSIEIEITERFLMDNTDENIKILETLRGYGFKISIDDFGTGYSSMSYLKKLPIDAIKIDKSFVDDIGDESSQNAIVEAIVALSKALGYSIVAEGIENKEQESFLANIECEIGQGYFFAKPMSSEEIIEKY